MADVTMTFNAETAQFIRGCLKIEDRQKHIEARQRKISEASGKGSRKAEQGHRAWASSLGSVVAGYLSVGAAIGIARKALADMNEERKRAAEGAKAVERGMGSLAQLAGTPQELRRLKREAYKSMAAEGMTEDEAGRLQFALTSAGKGKMRGTYARLYGLADPGEMLEAVATLQGAMGTRETGRDRQVLDKLFRASADTKATVTQLAGAAATAGKVASLAGFTDEQLLAGLAVGARGDVSADVVSTQIQGLAAFALKKGLRTDQGMMGIVSQIEGDKGLYRKLVKGRKEALKGFTMLSRNRAEVERMTRELQTADIEAATGKGDYTGARVGAYRGVFGAERATRIAGAREKLAELKYAEDELARERIISKFRERDIAMGGAAMPRALRTQFLKFWAWAGEDPERLRDIGQGFHEVDVGLRSTSTRKKLVTTKQGVDVTITVDDSRPPAGSRNALVE